MRRDPVVIIIVAMVVSLMLVFGLHMSRRGDLNASPSPDMRGQMAPDFALQSLDGKTVHLSDFRGKAVLLNFWATLCEPCRVEMPWFVELQNEYRSQGLQVVGVAMDDASSQDIAKFAQEMGVNYPVLIGKEAVGSAYGGVQFLPSTFYIGRDGKVVDKVFGLKGKGDIEEDVRKALAEGQTTQAQK